jgi:hypothetical protein
VIGHVKLFDMSPDVAGEWRLPAQTTWHRSLIVGCVEWDICTQPSRLRATREDSADRMTSAMALPVPRDKGEVQWTWSRRVSRHCLLRWGDGLERDDDPLPRPIRIEEARRDSGSR